MTLHCPACRKESEGEDLCPRCGCDLSILWLIRDAAVRETGVAAALLKAQKGHQALEHALRSWRLKKSVGAARQAFLACLLMGRFDQATAWYGRAVREAKEP